MSEQDCNDFIKEVKDKDSKLIKGVDTIEDYRKNLNYEKPVDVFFKFVKPKVAFAS
jgi:hypothetical protein